MRRLVTLLLLSYPTLTHSQIMTQTLIIEPESTFKISGKSNVNQFDCKIEEGFCGKSVNVCYNIQDSSLKFSNTKFSIPVDQFDCGSKYITRDMKATLKAEEYPKMTFELLRISNFEELNCGNSKAETLVTIAGVTNRYFLDYNLYKTDIETYEIHINSTFDINDFDLKTPTALMGLIKVNETINVSLTLLTHFE